MAGTTAARTRPRAALRRRPVLARPAPRPRAAGAAEPATPADDATPDETARTDLRDSRTDAVEHCARVRWPDGSEVPEALVRIGELDDGYAALRGADGLYRGHAPFGDMSWTAAAPRDGVLWTARARLRGTEGCAELTLAPPAAGDRCIVLRIRGPDGRPVPSATIRCVGGDVRDGPVLRFGVRLDCADGAAIVRVVRWRSPPVLFVHSATDGDTLLPLGAATFVPDLAGPAEQTVTLPADAGVHGRVVASDGSPVGGAEILVSRPDDPSGVRIPWAELGAPSRSDGAFECRGVPARGTRIAARLGLRTSRWAEAAPGDRDVVLTLSDGGLRAGVRVSLAAAAPDSSPRVRVSAGDDEFPPDRRGDVDWCVVPGGVLLDVTIECDGFVPVRRTWQPGPDTVLDVALRPLRSLVVRVVDAQGRPLPRAPVRVVSEDAADVTMCGGGEFRVDGIGVGAPASAELVVAGEVLDRAAWADGEDEVTLRWPDETSRLCLPFEPRPGTREDRVTLLAGGAVVAEADVAGGVATFPSAGLPELVHVVRRTRTHDGEDTQWEIEFLPGVAPRGVVSARLWHASEWLYLEFDTDRGPPETPVELAFSGLDGVAFTVDTDIGGRVYVRLCGALEWRIRARSADGAHEGDFVLDLRESDVLNHPRRFRFEFPEPPAPR